MASSISTAISAPVYDPDKPVALIYKPVGSVEYLKEGKQMDKSSPGYAAAVGRPGKNRCKIFCRREVH